MQVQKHGPLTDPELIELQVMTKLWALAHTAERDMLRVTGRNWRGAAMDRFTERTERLCELMRSGEPREALRLTKRHLKNKIARLFS